MALPQPQFRSTRFTLILFLSMYCLLPTTSEAQRVQTIDDNQQSVRQIRAKKFRATQLTRKHRIAQVIAPDSGTQLAPICSGNETVLKDTFNDFNLWSSSVPPDDDIAFLSEGPGGNTEARLYIGFTATKNEILKSLSFPVLFSFHSDFPVNNPSSNPYRLSVKLYENLADLTANPLLIDAELIEPGNSNWQDNVIASLAGGYDVFLHEWDLSELNYQLNAGSTYYLTIIALPPHSSLDEQPAVPLITGTGTSIGSQDDYFFLEGIFDPPTPLNTFFSGSEVAVLLTSAEQVQSETLIPLVYTDVRGIHRNGSLNDLESSNDSYLEYYPGPTTNSTEPAILLDFSSTISPCALSNVESIELVIETGANTPGLERKIEIYNFDNSSWETNDVRAEDTNDNIFTFTISDPTTYYEPSTGELRVRLGWTKTGITFLYPYTIRIDEIRWTVQLGS